MSSRENLNSVAEVLRGQDPKVLEWVEILRQIVREAMPEAEERGIKGWGNIAYDYNGIVCYIQPLKSGVNLGFYKGTSLTDPDQLLQGTGKNLRHVKIRKKEDIRLEALRQLIQEAYRLNTG